MKPLYDQQARKRPVNLTLNEELVLQARTLTDNLSSVVETLLKDFVVHEHQQHLTEAKALETNIATWNDFSDKNGSFADEHSTL